MEESSATEGKDRPALDIDLINRSLENLKNLTPRIKPGMAWFIRHWAEEKLWAIRIACAVKNIPILRNIFWKYRSAYFAFIHPDSLKELQESYAD